MNTAQNKSAERRAKLAALAKQVTAMTPEERANLARQSVLTIEGRTLSGKNQILLIMQRASVSVVGGFQQWRAAGRIVRKGEKSLAIWIPTAGRQSTEEDGESTRPGFRLASVFDIEQTEEMPA